MAPSSSPANPLLTITDLPYGGRGMARLEGKICFVPGVLPGETVRIKITRDRHDFMEAEPVEILTPSPHRIPPACPLAFDLAAPTRRPHHAPSTTSCCPHHAPSTTSCCPGCCYQHVGYEEEIRIKQKQLQSLLTRQAGVQADILLAPVAAPTALGYRNKMALHAQADGKEMRLGYYMTDNTTVLDVPACPLAVPPLNELLEDRRSDPSFRRTLKDGMTVTFRWTGKDGAVWWRNRAAENDIWLVESSLIGPLSVPRNSFYQMNPVMADRLIEAVLARLREAAPDTVVDLYCGVGIFALAAATLGIPHVIGVDIDGPGIKAAEYNARRMELSNTRWIAATARQGVDRFELPQPEKSVLIVDPPRSGLGRSMIEEILRHRPNRILYISCGPDTMVRDAAWLREGGYRIHSSQLFDLFPRTAHFESLTEFRIER